MNLALLVLLLGLSALFTWAARRPDTRSYERGRLIGGTICLLALAIVVGYFHFKDVHGPVELEKIIPVYPEFSSVTWVPPVSEERYWLLESSDPPEEVVAFYEGVATEEGWELERAGGGRMIMLTLKRDGTRVFLTVTREGDGSKLSYHVGSLKEE